MVDCLIKNHKPTHTKELDNQLRELFLFNPPDYVIFHKKPRLRWNNILSVLIILAPTPKSRRPVERDAKRTPSRSFC